VNRILVTVPAHNERPRISACLATLRGELDPARFRIAVVEDGSTDGTRAELDAVKRSFPELILRSFPSRLGRGRALRTLWATEDADAYCYVDADLPAGAEAVSKIVGCIEAGADISTASRYCPGAKVSRPPVVMSASRAYNRMIRWTFNDGVWDHQCGLKAMSRGAFRTLDRMVEDGSWFWDTENLVLAKRLGLNVAEVPVDWAERRYARTSFRRLAKEVPYFGQNILRLKARIASRAISLHPGQTATIPNLPRHGA
jgi:glycosyltransferase involved in cell wall biosynthesis